MIRQHPPQHLQPDNALWHFALTLWQRRPFEQACLDAQSVGFSVSHLLVALYAARTGYHWTGEEPPAITHWRTQMTESIRTLRTHLIKHHDSVDTLRNTLKKAELESERIELAWWHHHIHHASTTEFQPAPNDESPDVLARRNLSRIGSRDLNSDLANAVAGGPPPAAMGERGMSAGGGPPATAPTSEEDDHKGQNDDGVRPGPADIPLSPMADGPGLASSSNSEEAGSNTKDDHRGQNDDGVGLGPADIPPSPMAVAGNPPSSAQLEVESIIDAVLSAAHPLPAVE